MQKLLFVLSIAAASFVSTAEPSRIDWQRKAAERHPEIGVPGSKLNVAFLKAVADAKRTRPEVFARPEWPMLLAEEITRGHPHLGAAASIGSVVRAGAASEGEATLNTTPKAPANPSVEAIERALASRNVPAIVEACGRFTHRAGTFRAFVSNTVEHIVGARDTLAQTERANRQMQSEVARLRRNAEVSDQAIPLDPKDNSHRVRAAETRKRADQLESRSNQQLRKAKEVFESNLAALSSVLRNIRESDAEDWRKSTQQVQVERESSQRLIAMKLFLAFIEEPEGRPAFAAESVEPSYQETLEVINGKLAASHWHLRYGAKSNAFILQHPGGAFFVEFSALNPQVKSGTEERHEVQLEVAQTRPALRTISKEGVTREDVRSIAIPCDNKADSEKLAQAFRHLILMAGGKDAEGPGILLPKG